jgi:hypothetical protein
MAAVVAFSIRRALSDCAARLFEFLPAEPLAACAAAPDTPTVDAPTKETPRVVTACKNLRRFISSPKENHISCSVHWQLGAIVRNLLWAPLMTEGMKALCSMQKRILAAVAEAYDCIVVTDNKRDFTGLGFINPLRFVIGNPCAQVLECCRLSVERIKI